MASSPLTVLVVDDEPAIRLLCKVNLGLEGHRVLEAERLDDARALLGVEPVDVILLDVHVGNEDGLAFVSELREGHPAVSIALLTGSAMLTGDQQESVDAVISKPFAIESLTETVRNLAAR